MVSSAFHFNPLREEYYKFERVANEQLLYAEHHNITGKFLSMMKKKLNRKRPENIHIIIYGPTRDGKTYSAMSICEKNQRDIFEMYGEWREINIHPNDSAFLDAVPTAQFQSIHIIDEKDQTTVQDGSMAELMQMEDFNNICAKKALIVVRLKPQEIFAETAHFILKTHGQNTDLHRNRLLVKIREDQYERWIGHIQVPLDPILCPDRRANIVQSCHICPKYEQNCQEFIAKYERRKDANIQRIAAGGPEARTEIRRKIAQEYAELPSFDYKASNDALCLELEGMYSDRSIFKSATNRRFTKTELRQIVALAKKYKKDSLEEKE
jgi:hypothetical protein